MNCGPVLALSDGSAFNRDVETVGHLGVKLLFDAAQGLHEPVGVPSLIRERVDACVLDREGSGDGIDVRGCAVLLVGSPIDSKTRIPVRAKMSDEGIHNLTIIHCLCLLLQTPPTVLSASRKPCLAGSVSGGRILGDILLPLSNAEARQFRNHTH